MIRILILFFLSFTVTQPLAVMRIEDNKQPDQVILSFGLIADVQYCEIKNYGSRFFSNSLTKLCDAIDDLNNSDIDFIFNLGDLIDRDFKSFKPVMQILEKSDNRIYHVLGNHDLTLKHRYKKDVKDMLTGENSYYSFTQQGFRFIALNTCEISTYYGPFLSALKARMILDKLKSESYPNAFDWNGEMSKKQIEWFISELEEARDKNEHVLVFSHHTIEPAGPHNVFNRKEMLEIISGYDHIIAWFSGHDHSGGYRNSHNVHFITMKGMVETADKNAWAIVEVYNHKLLIKGRGLEESRILEY
ncbi:MAG: metallophosphoesterase [Bacteroidales bacterium]|nr:metallophosphoesterase [Bacteroidales bacterium]